MLIRLKTSDYSCLIKFHRIIDFCSSRKIENTKDHVRVEQSIIKSDTRKKYFLFDDVIGYFVKSTAEFDEKIFAIFVIYSKSTHVACHKKKNILFE